MGSGYYDKQGKKLTLMEWATLFDDHDYRVIALTKGCGRTVFTVWIGLDQSFGSGKAPLIFESKVVADDSDNELDQVRYATEKEALEGHHRLCTDHAYILDRIVKKLEEEDAAVDDSGPACASEAAD